MNPKIYISFLFLFAFTHGVLCQNDVSKKDKEEFRRILEKMGASGYTNTNIGFLATRLKPDSLTKVKMTADFEHPINCPVELTNVLWNTNLLSIEESKRIRERVTRFKDLTVDSIPSGTILQKSGQRTVDVSDMGIFYDLTYKRYTNGSATEELTALPPRFIVRSRDAHGDGFDASFSQNEFGLNIFYQEFFKNTPEGLMMILGMPDKSANINLLSLVRFKKGKAVGNYLEWGNDGSITTSIEFSEPYDFIRNMKVRYDVGWAFENKRRPILGR